MQYHSALTACSNAEIAGTAAAQDLFKEMLERGLSPNIITYTNLVRSLKDATAEELLTLLSDMRAKDIKADKMFVENFLFALLKVSKKRERWTPVNAVAELENRPLSLLAKAKSVLAEFRQDGVTLGNFCTLVEDILESMDEVA